MKKKIKKFKPLANEMCFVCVLRLTYVLFDWQLSETNFSNISDFRSFLKSLLATFKEFKMHEQIENEYIISLLEERCCTVYNMHSDNKLSDMLLLLEKGLHNVKVGPLLRCCFRRMLSWGGGEK